MIEVIPTIFSLDLKEFKERMDKLSKFSDKLQVDIMDGKFVSNKSVDLKKIKLEKKKYFELHLMTLEPGKYIDIAKKKGFKKIIFHLSSVKDKNDAIKLIRKIKRKKMEVFLALNPKKDMTDYAYYLHEVDGIMFMGVNPGKEGQNFLSSVYNEIKKLREFSKEIIIQVDGGVNLESAKKLKDLGVNIVNTGSFVSKSKVPEQVYTKLVTLLNS